MSKGMAIYAGRLFGERALGLALFLLATGGQLGLRACIWFAIYFASVISALWLYRTSAETLERRADIASTKDVTPTWDKVILALFWLLGYFVIYYVAGATADLGKPIDVLFIGGLILYGMSTALTAWALQTNAYAESVSRVQSERDQQVCSSGPYAYVRHPMYSAILMWCVAIVAVFPTRGVALVSLAVAALIVLRTLLEDNMLAEGLPGYEQYRRTVRWRLIPKLF